MDSNQDITTRKSFTLKLVKQVEHLWNRLINIGIGNETNDFDKKRTRLINGICSWAFVIYLMYVFSYASDQKVQFVFYESLAGIIGYALPIILNYTKRYNLA